MSKFLKMLTIIEEKFLVYSLMFTTALIFFQVIMRYVFSNSLSWSEELTRYVFLWQIWIGASFAISEKKHLKIDLLINRLRNSTRRIFSTISIALWGIFCLFLAVKGIELVAHIYRQEQLSPAMEIPMAIPYIAIPAGGVLMLIKLIYEFIYIFRDNRQGG